MISAINNLKGKTISNKNMTNMSFKGNDYSERSQIDDLSFMPDSRDLVSNKGESIYEFVNNVRKDVDVALAEQKVNMLREKYSKLEDGVKKEVLAGMIEDALDELETVKIHFNLL